MNEHLARARQTADVDAGGGISTSASPDDRTVPYLLAGILDALVAIAEQQTNVPPGPCLHSLDVIWPNGDQPRPRCELRAGHAGAHECGQDALGGFAAWTDTPDTHTQPTTDPANVPGRSDFEETLLNAPIEVTTRYATSVDDLPAAWAFVMDHIDQVGNEPSIEIRPIHSFDIIAGLGGLDSQPRTSFEVTVSGMVAQ